MTARVATLPIVLFMDGLPPSARLRPERFGELETDQRQAPGIDGTRLHPLEAQGNRQLLVTDRQGARKYPSQGLHVAAVDGARLSDHRVSDAQLRAQLVFPS